MEKRVTVRWSAGLDFEAVTDEGASVRLGGPESPQTFRPAGLVLAALAGCTGMDAISIMAKKRIQIESYHVEAVGQQRDEHPRFFTSIVVTHVIEGTAIDDVAVGRAVELSARKYCVVGANLASGDTTINHLVVVRDEKGQRECDCLTIGPKGRGLSHYGAPDGGLGAFARVASAASEDRDRSQG
jgi:putative redox protein